MHKPEPLQSGETSSRFLVNGLLAFFIALVGMIIGPIIGLFFAMPFYNGSIIDLAQSIQNAPDHPEIKVPIYIIQGVGSLIGLAILPLLFLSLRKQRPVKQFFSKRSSLLAAVLTVVVVITFMGFNSWFIEWNSSVHLPDSLKALENWAREKEDAATMLTDYLTAFDNPFQFILAFVVIAVIPGFAEELVFRGILQGYLQRSGVNVHVAIWLGAFLFSAIHFQFFGFVPRLFLGALFGYLYAWSGDLKIPILAHFTNNAFTVVLVYLYQLGVVGENIVEPESTSLTTAVIFSIITLVLLIVLHRHFLNKRVDDSMEKSL